MKIVNRTKKEVYQRWIAALRSGKYRQGKYVLKQINSGGASFCCLGVLCDLAAKDGGEPWAGEYYGVNRNFPPNRITTFMTPKEDKFGKLAEMNDTGKSFAQIADYIENVIMPVECP